MLELLKWAIFLARYNKLGLIDCAGYLMLMVQRKVENRDHQMPRNTETAASPMSADRRKELPQIWIITRGAQHGKHLGGTQFIVNLGSKNRNTISGDRYWSSSGSEWSLVSKQFKRRAILIRGECLTNISQIWPRCRHLGLEYHSAHYRLSLATDGSNRVTWTCSSTRNTPRRCFTHYACDNIFVITKVWRGNEDMATWI